MKRIINNLPRFEEKEPCVFCAGYGVVKGETCWGCNGSGKDVWDGDDEEEDEEVFMIECKCGHMQDLEEDGEYCKKCKQFID